MVQVTMRDTAKVLSAALLCLALCHAAQAAGRGRPDYGGAAQQLVSYDPDPYSEHKYGFLDVFMGAGSPDMKLVFGNSQPNITLNNTGANDLGISVGSLSSDTHFKTVSFGKLATAGLGPIAVRYGGYGKGILGGDVELSFAQCNVKKQTAAWKLNGAGAGNVTFSTDDYATVKSLGVTGALLVRYPGKRLDPYVGAGVGLSLNQINMPYVKSHLNSSVLPRPVKDLGMGLMLRVPVGVRLRLGSRIQLVTELRYELNHILFDRKISGESDTITLSGVKFLGGLGYMF